MAITPNEKPRPYVCICSPICECVCLCVRECVGAGFALNTHAFAYNKMSSHCCVLGLFALSFVCMSVCMQMCVYVCL